MAEKRDVNRKNRRLQVRYGIDSLDRVGFTCDINSEGLFIQTSNIARPGTVLRMELAIPGGSPVRFIGRVQWARKVPPNLLSLVKKGGMGIRIIRFVAGEEAYSAYCAELFRR
jgi:hypothetical protein